MQIEVLTTVWGAGDAEFAGGVHEVKLTRTIAAIVAGAEAAGTIRVVGETAAERKMLDRHVQSQDDGEAAYEKAQAEGRWQHGNLLQFVTERREQLEATSKLHPLQRRRMKSELDHAEAALAEVKAP